MTKKRLITVLLFFVSLQLVSQKLPDFLEKPYKPTDFSIKFDSFVGSDYHPHFNIDDKKFSYFEKNDFLVRWDYYPLKNSQIFLGLSYKDDLFEEDIEIEQIGIRYDSDKILLEYKFDTIGFGSRSEIFILNILDPYYSKKILGEYQFHGIKTGLRQNNFLLFTEIGGNSLNSSIFDFVIEYSNNRFYSNVFYLFTARDSRFNKKMHSIGSELFYDFSLLKLYQTFTYQKMIKKTNSPEKTNLVNLSEIVLKINKKLSLGVNYKFNKIDYDDFVEKENQTQTFLRFKHQKFIETIIYNYYTDSNYFNRRINLLSDYQVFSFWTIGLNGSIIKPSIGDDFYQVGIQSRLLFNSSSQNRKCE